MRKKSVREVQEEKARRFRGKTTCEECLEIVDGVRMFNDTLCIPCARSAGLVGHHRESAIEAESKIRKEKEKVRREFEENAAKDFRKDVEAQKEIADRELARRRLLPFIKRMKPEYEAGWVHADITQRLEKFAQDIIDRKSPRLMLFLPPRAGKSEIGSKMFPAWFLGRYPKLETIISSYSGDLAAGFSRNVRNIFSSPEFSSIFPKSRLSTDSKAADKWSTTDGGGLNAVGVSGALSGKGGSLLIVDDPHKDRNEAESEKMRQTVKDWYSSTFYTRRAPGAGILVIQTRWHEDDLSGWLLTEMEKANKAYEEEDGSPFFDKWEVVKYPAIAKFDEKYRKRGEALHPERFPIHELETTKTTLIPRDWEALYQQEPTSDDGDFFTKDMFRFYSPADLPDFDDMRFYAAADLAISQKQTADFTVFAVIGVDRKQNLWLVDLFRGRWNSLGIIEKMFHVQEKYNPEIFGIETGQIELTLEPFIQKHEQDTGVTLRYEKLKTRGADKVARARPIQGRMEQNRVFFPEIQSVDWMQDVHNELLKFPLGMNDDIVDAISWVGQMLMLFGVKNEKREKPKKSFRDNLHKYVKRGYRDSGKKTGMSA